MKKLFGILFTLWFFGGVRVLLLQDLPLLAFLGIGIALLMLPISRWFWKPKNWWVKSAWWLGCKLGIITAILAVLVFVLPPFSISRQTTYLTEPRATRFYGIDYAAAIEKQLTPNIPPSENGFRLLAETFGWSFIKNYIEEDEKYEEYWNHLCKTLDLPRDIEPKLTYVDLWDYARRNQENNNLLQNLKIWNADDILPFPEEAMPLIRGWLDENDAALDMFAAATKKSILYLPPKFNDILLFALLHDVDICHKMKNGLETRARYRLTVGEIDEAWDDVMTIYRIAEKQRPTVWNMLLALVNRSIVGTANRYAEAVMLRSEWTPDEIRRKTEEIAVFQRPFSDDEIRTVIFMERLITLDAIQYLADGIDIFTWSPEPRRKLVTKTVARFFRVEHIMVETNRQFDEMEQWFLDDIPAPERKTPGTSDVPKIIAWRGPVGSFSVLGKLIVDSTFIFSNESCRIYFKTHRANTSLTQLVFALEAYAREHDGQYPDSLEVFGEIPHDPFSGKPFRYVASEGGYLLYSVGKNGIDEDGREWDEESESDDIRRRR